jgi:putative nucleotidyltransferase-like protein
MAPSKPEQRRSRREVAADQFLLLRTAVLDDERALEAWDRWSATADPERMESGEARLIAGAFRRLEAIGAGGPMMAVARGIYRRTWYANQLAVARIAAVMERLDEVEVPSLVLKGFALAPLAYGDLGARPMEDVDMLVPPEMIERAVESLEPLGMRQPLGNKRPDGLLANEVELIDEGGNSVELHAYALVESTDDSDLWERRVRFSVREAVAYAPCPEDALLLVIVHGQRWNPVQPVSWVLDACRLVESKGGDFDWERFVARAEARDLTLAAARGVGMLQSFDVDVPPAVAERLCDVPVGLGRRLGDRASRSVPGRVSAATLAWDRYRRFRHSAPAGARPSGPLDWAGRVWGVDGVAELPAEGARRLAALNRAVAGRVW